MRPRTLFAKLAYRSLDAASQSLVQMDVRDYFPNGINGRQDFNYVFGRALLQ